MPYTFIPSEYPGGAPTVRFTTPMDFVEYVRDLQAGKHPGVEADAGSIRQAQQIAENPDGWVMSGGHPAPKEDWLARNLPWLGPAAIGGGIAAAAIPGLLAGGAGGAAPTSAGAAGTAGTTAGAAGTTAGAAGTTAGTAGGTAAGLLPSYGPTAAMQTAGAGLPSVTAVGSGAGAGATGGGILSQIGNQFRNDPLGTLGTLGDQLGKGAQGAAEGRRSDAYAQAAAGRVNLDAMALDQRRAVLRSLLGGVQDASISRPEGSTIPTFNVTGGLRPSALSDKPSLLAELGRPAPTVDPPVAGAGERAMGIGGGILGMLGSLGRNPYRYRTPPFNPNGGYS